MKRTFKEVLQGTLGEEQVKEMLSMLLPADTVDNVSKMIFSTFDKDNSGSLSFVEFVLSIHCMSTNSPEVSEYLIIEY